MWCNGYEYKCSKMGMRRLLDTFFKIIIELLTVPELHDSHAVTKNGNDAFISRNVISISLPEGLTHTGGNAFRCSNLTSLSLPNSLISIGSEVLWGPKIVSITIPSHVRSLGERGF